MTAAVIVYILIVTLPLIGGAVLAEKTCRLWRWPVRGAWIVTALVMLSIGARVVARQVLPSHGAPVAVPMSAMHLARGTDMGRPNAIASATSELVSLPRTVAHYVASAVPPVYDRILAILWAAASIVVLTLMCSVYARVWHARRKWKVMQLSGHSVRVAPHAGPAVVGLFRTEIVIPQSILEASLDDGRLIVMHEMEHQRARDPLLLAAMWGFVALFPWHPGAWYCLARTRLAIELDCDARIVRRGTSVRSYAQLLVNQARARLSAPLHLWLGATSLLEPASHLERRLNAMMPSNNPSSARGPLARYVRTLSYVAIVSAVTITACESRLPTENDISGMNVATAEKDARNVSFIGTAQPTYYINGVAVSADQAHALAPSDIQSIAFVRHASKSEPAEVRISSNTTPTERVANLTGALPPKMQSGDRGRVIMMRQPLGDNLSSRPLSATGGELHAVFMKADSSAAAPFSGQIIIDGVTSDLAALSSINPSAIKSIEIVKGPAAVAQSSDPSAVRGIIRVTLKH